MNFYPPEAVTVEEITRCLHNCLFRWFTETTDKIVKLNKIKMRLVIPGAYPVGSKITYPIGLTAKVREVHEIGQDKFISLLDASCSEFKVIYLRYIAHDDILLLKTNMAAQEFADKLDREWKEREQK
jgi:hypothetical protein